MKRSLVNITIANYYLSAAITHSEVLDCGQRQVLTVWFTGNIPTHIEERDPDDGSPVWAYETIDHQEEIVTGYPSELHVVRKQLNDMANAIEQEAKDGVLADRQDRETSQHLSYLLDHD